jgi:Abortive infection alpha
MESKGNLTTSGPLSSLLAVTDEQAKAITSVATFGTTVVTESSDLVRYVGRVLGTVPHDAVGLVLGDPLKFVRTAIAAQYDVLLDKILKRRNVTETQPVSPSVAIPLLRSAYDESRPELQKLWAALIAAAMDPQRSARVRLSFIDTLKRFDPLDALVLKARCVEQGVLQPSALIFIATTLRQPAEEVQASVENLKALRCVEGAVPSFYINNYGKLLIKACSD